MNGFGQKIKAFFKNKNTVTILGVIAILALLYYGYSKQIKSSVSPLTVPVASQTIPARTLIVDDYITLIEVPSIAVTNNVYTSRAAVLGKYSNVNTVIPAGSMFYKEAVVSENDFRDSIFDDMEEGKIPYLFKVNMETTFGNSIYPNSKVDVYMKAIDESGKIIVGKLLEDVMVYAVRDNAGNDVFADTTNVLIPNYFVFGVDEDIHLLLRKANYITSNSIELFPIPHGRTYTGDETRVSTEYLKEFILSKTIILEGQESTTSTETNN